MSSLQITSRTELSTSVRRMVGTRSVTSLVELPGTLFPVGGSSKFNAPSVYAARVVVLQNSMHHPVSPQFPGVHAPRAHSARRATALAACARLSLPVLCVSSLGGVLA